MSWRTSVGKSVQELRIQFSQTGSSSQALRNFVHKEYVELKKANPKLPILIREHNKIEPRITARYDYGVEKTVQAANASDSDIVSKIQELIKYADSLPKHDDSTQKQVTQ